MIMTKKIKCTTHEIVCMIMTIKHSLPVQK